ncbi:hypothetical protein CONLIGDRAFT_33389 [Coniochaeta ligniaria NRRL 30616]|uniref:Uncharacterized protein n=1 Tax=Coniochaeta ligniaria NRRL 30616 TaxID=1408157 RepID=A0A1J7J4E4_9PEZI|nr:hypothetical protein CONLIGDRAFT_33389 [Coniochaeta ligniaria NRRL 30616]
MTINDYESQAQCFEKLTYLRSHLNGDQNLHISDKAIVASASRLVGEKLHVNTHSALQLLILGIPGQTIPYEPKFSYSTSICTPSMYSLFPIPFSKKTFVVSMVSYHPSFHAHVPRNTRTLSKIQREKRKPKKDRPLNTHTHIASSESAT